MDSRQLSIFSRKYWIEKFLIIWSFICLFFSTFLPSEDYSNNNNRYNGNNRGGGNSNERRDNIKYMRFCSPGG